MMFEVADAQQLQPLPGALDEVLGRGPARGQQQFLGRAVEFGAIDLGQRVVLMD